MLRRVLAAACLAAAATTTVGLVRPPPPPTTAVVVAARGVPAGTVLGAADVTVAELPRAASPPGVVTEVADAVGRRVGSGLAAGEALTRTRLVPRSPDEGMPAGLVALHVSLADPVAAGLAAPGTRVRVYAATGGAALSRTATVLAVDPPPESDLVGLGGGDPGRGLVLALPPADAERVLAGHGALEGPPLVNVVTGPP